MQVTAIVKSKLFNNIVNLFILQGFGYIYPILLIPFLINTIGVEKYGLVYYSVAFAWYFQVISEFGFDLSNVKHVVDNRNCRQKLSEIFCCIVINRLLLASILFIVYLTIIFTLPKFREYYMLYIIAYLRVFSTAFLPYWLFRSLENVKEVTRISLIVKTICILPIFFIVKNENDYIWVISFFSLNEVISSIVGVIMVRKCYNLKYVRCSFTQMKFYFKDSIPFFTSTVATRLYTNSNILVVGSFLGEYAAGIYSVSEKLYNVYSAIVAPLIQHVFYPYFMRIKNIIRMNKVITFAVGINIILLVVVYFIVPYILPFFIKVGDHLILDNFNLFLILLAIDVPVMFLGYPYLGVLNNKIKYVNLSAITASVFHLMGLCVLYITNILSMSSVIILLIMTQIVCLIQRIIYINKCNIVK